MIELVVDTTNPTPPYEQLRRQLADLITAGALPPGQRLPPLRQLAGDLGLAVGTVARTYRELESAGLIASRRGGGTRVAADPPLAMPTLRDPRPLPLHGAAPSSPGVPAFPRPASAAPGGVAVPSAGVAASSTDAAASPAVAAASSAGVAASLGGPAASPGGAAASPGGVAVPSLDVVVSPAGVSVSSAVGVSVSSPDVSAASPEGLVPLSGSDSLRAVAEAYVRQARALGARTADIAAAVHLALGSESASAADAEIGSHVQRA